MANRDTIKSFIKQYEVLVSSVYRFLGRNVRKVKGKGNVIKANKAFLKRCRFNIIGDNNVISRALKSINNLIVNKINC